MTRTSAPADAGCRPQAGRLIAYHAFAAKQKPVFEGD